MKLHCYLISSPFTHPGVSTDGDSPLDLALRGNKLDTALYLINRGCGSKEDKCELLFKGCRKGDLTVVRELVEQHNINPKGE